MILVVHLMVRPLRPQHHTVHHPGLSQCKITYVNHLLNLTHSFLKNLAGFDANEPAQVFLVIAQLDAYLPHNLGSLRSRPPAPLQERTLGPFDHQIIVIITRTLYSSYISTGGRVLRHNHRATRLRPSGPGTYSTIGFFNHQFFQGNINSFCHSHCFFINSIMMFQT